MKSLEDFEKECEMSSSVFLGYQAALWSADSWWARRRAGEDSEEAIAIPETGLERVYILDTVP